MVRTSPVSRIIYAFICSAVLLSAYGDPAIAGEYRVTSKEEYFTRVQDLSPGDTVVLANGTWRDFEMIFSGTGTKDRPITLTAEEKGKVIISGVSNLKLAGEHLVVSGLVFRDGYSPTESVISFRKNVNELANHSRVTETVIDGFNKPERSEVDYWVAIYGKHNRYDHNHLEGKGNKGVTVAVRLDTEASRENHHRIDHNYFGPRPVLGSNGGETLRIGTSHYSLSDSLTLVENNYFYKANGEHEIISNKSGGNIYRGNVFFESLGTLTMRHGHGTLVENNVFFGNGLPHTGGIRVINRRQTVRNNYLENLTDFRFRGALVIMNGIPNAPLNRYDPVEDALVENNTVINSKHIALGAGSTDEINAVPTDTRFRRNLIYNESGEDIFDIYDDISGIAFSDNVLNKVREPQIERGFRSMEVTLERAANGLLYPVSPDLAGIGATRELAPVTREETGVPWYPKNEPRVQFASGKAIQVPAEAGALEDAIAAAAAGDVLELAPGRYKVEKILVIDKPLTISGNNKAHVEYERTTLFEIVDGGSLHLQGLAISGASSPDYRGNSVVRTSRYSMLTNYRLRVENCEITDLDVNLYYNFLSTSPGTLADRVEIVDSSFSDVSGAILKLDPDKTPYGTYSAEYVTIEDSRFDRVQGALIEIFSEAGESVFGPHFALTGSRLNDVGLGSLNPSGASIYLHGLLSTEIGNNRFRNSAGIQVNHLIGMPVTRIVDNSFESTPPPEVAELYYDKEHTAILRGNTVH